MQPAKKDGPPTLPGYFPLREELSIHRRGGLNQSSLLEDKLRRKFYRLGPLECSFVSVLIETQSPAEAFERTRRSENQEPSQTQELTLEKAVMLCKWLAVNGLTRSPENTSTKKPIQWAKNPLMSVFSWQIGLVNPDRLLEAISNAFGWLFSPQAMAVGLFCFVASLLQTSGHWVEFVSSYDNLFSTWRWYSLAIAWCLLKLIHETAHGVTCRRYGGEVNDAGLAFILLVPIPYINVTSSWRFSSRWQRLHVTLAGVAVELFVAGVALIAWNMLDSLPFKQAAADVVLMASVSTLLFNLNPLLKFDGYYALADLTGVDNLFSYGQSYARYFGCRYVLGLYVTPPKLPGARTPWIKFYGISAAVYRVFTVFGLLTAAAAIFNGAGIVVAIAGTLSFVGKPVFMLVQYLYKLRRAGELHVLPLTVRLACISTLLAAPLWVIPVEWSWTAPAIVEFDPPAVIRARSAGFVTRIHVRDGEAVTSGQPIISLRNEDLELRLFELRKQIAQVQQEILAARWQNKSSELSDAEARQAGLRDQYFELETSVEELVLRAPCDGIVVSRRLALIPDTYIKTGEELAVVGRENAKRLKLSVSQNEARQADEWIGHPLRIIVDGHSTWTSILSRLETRADSKPPDESLIAVNGGPLAAVRQGADALALCEPRVNAYVALSQSESLPLRCGQRAYVRLKSDRLSIAQWIIANARRVLVEWTSVTHACTPSLSLGRRCELDKFSCGSLHFEQAPIVLHKGL